MFHPLSKPATVSEKWHLVSLPNIQRLHVRILTRWHSLAGRAVLDSCGTGSPSAVCETIVGTARGRDSISEQTSPPPAQCAQCSHLSSHEWRLRSLVFHFLPVLLALSTTKLNTHTVQPQNQTPAVIYSHICVITTDCTAHNESEGEVTKESIYLWYTQNRVCEMGKGSVLYRWKYPLYSYY